MLTKGIIIKELGLFYINNFLYQFLLEEYISIFYIYVIQHENDSIFSPALTSHKVIQKLKGKYYRKPLRLVGTGWFH